MEWLQQHMFKNWLVYIMLGGFIWFVISVYIHAWHEKKKVQNQDKSQENKQK